MTNVNLVKLVNIQNVLLHLDMRLDKKKYVKVFFHCYFMIPK